MTESDEHLEFHALHEIVAAARARWTDLGRVVLLHRIGDVPLTESAVVVAVSAPHRDAAFEAARFGIDTLKATVPIWKREDWSEGTSWGREAQHIVPVEGTGDSEGTGSTDGAEAPDGIDIKNGLAAQPDGADGS